MTECAGCGDCCETVVPNTSVPDLRRKLQNPRLAGAARREYTKIVNMLTERADPVFPSGKRGRPGKPAYRCRHFNAQTRRCEAHDERPLMCRGYPWYPPGGPLPLNRIPADLSPRCSFIADVRNMLPLIPV